MRFDQIAQECQRKVSTMGKIVKKPIYASISDRVYIHFIVYCYLSVSIVLNTTCLVKARS